MQREGQIRIPAGCAISGVISREGNSICGSEIVRSPIIQKIQGL